ncbi:hypothetical protein GH714_017949 [Hevea brasiliensis]|uniref:Uncharacterized protein n=1 Tax=Hevea brasiliensis TaxID=3981 RepID=A0A6A6N309_HEVBR|nr:hypothetical protein GH714_017949 [Hevea brasiliensis]
MRVFYPHEADPEGTCSWDLDEERKRSMDFVPEVCAIKTDQKIEVDKKTIDMLSALGMGDIPGIVQVEPVLFP